jgi:signal transduction histidine kinase
MRVVPAAGPLFVRADRTKAEQVLLNLLSNAVKFTDSGGSITVRVDRRGQRIEFAVTDTGVGIPAEDQESIFEPFVQVGRSLTTAHEGTGLGLAISRDLARAMGGDLTVVSDVGAGSTFTFSLPAAGDGDGAAT